MTVSEYLVSFLVSLITVGIKGFQHRNMAGRHVKLVFATAWLIVVGDIATIGLVVKGGWAMLPSLGLGASIGMVLSIYVHDRIVKPGTGSAPPRQGGT